MMKFTETKLAGMFIIESDVFPDERGSFEAAWHQQALSDRGLEHALAQASLASNHRRGTIRGLHFQAAPFEEVKIVRVIRGSAWDVAVDLRRDSPTFRQWCALELSAANRRMAYIPRGFAHGYETLEDDTDVLYFVSAPYAPAHTRGLRWDDPAIGIDWPIRPPTVISARDASHPHGSA
jgi:dTDP-4-dehydrorhamnose 3,5-epimerase